MRGKQGEVKVLNINHESFYKKFPAFSLAQEVKELAQPLFRSINANYFDYCRMYEDNSFFTLTTDCLWLEHFFKSKHKLAPDFKSSGRHLWNSTYYNTLTHDARVLFNHDHGISIFYKKADYIEYVDIAAPQDAPEITSIYLNHPHYIDNFVAEFVERSQCLISQAEKQLVFIPTEMCDKEKVEKDIANSLDPFSKYNLTLREMECLKNFLKGQTAKETASEFQLSPRTVEHHMNNIKAKLKCKSKRDLIKLFYK